MQTHHGEEPPRSDLMRVDIDRELRGRLPPRFPPRKGQSLDTPTPQYHLPIDRIFILSAILVSFLHHLFIDTIAFIRFCFHRVSSIICLMSKYSFSCIKYQSEMCLSTKHKTGFWKNLIDRML